MFATDIGGSLPEDRCLEHVEHTYELTFPEKQSFNKSLEVLENALLEMFFTLYLYNNLLQTVHTYFGPALASLLKVSHALL